MSYQHLIQEYLSGLQQLQSAVAGMTEEQLHAAPIPGKWSTLQVVCHIADFEPVYADRMKRVIAEEEAQLLSGDPDLFAARLAYHVRDVREELAVISSVRHQMARILAAQTDSVFQRAGRHSVDGLLTLETLLRRITGHIPHHVSHILEKRAALGLK